MQASSVGSDSDGDEIYLIDDTGVDEDQLLALQMELAITKKKLACVESAYKQLENEYLEFKDSHSLAAVIVADVAYKNAGSNSDGAAAAAQTIALAKKNLVEHGLSLDSNILLIWSPHATCSREFIEGFSSVKESIVIQSSEIYKMKHITETLCHLPQVKRVFVTLAGPTTSSFLLPLLSSALTPSILNDAIHASPNLPSPSVKRRRSWTSNSTLSNLTKVGSSDNLWSKITLLSSGKSLEYRKGLELLKDGLLTTYQHEKGLYREILEMDLSSLLSHCESQGLFEEQPEPRRPPTPTSPPRSRFTTVAKPIIEPIGTPARTSESVWAQVVRKGRQKSDDKLSDALPATDGAQSVPALPTLANNQSPTITSRTQTVPMTPTSPVLQDRQAPNSAINRNRRRSGSIKKDSQEAASDAYSYMNNINSSQHTVSLDPSVSLCKQKKPPCNQYYLTKRGCTNPKCNYAHNYKLTSRQLEEMRHGAAKTACVYRKTGQPCQSGEECVFGHLCPQGSRCKQGGRCQFPAHMH